LRLHSEDILDQQSIECLNTIQAKGQVQYETFVDERLRANAKRITATITRNKIVLFNEQEYKPKKWRDEGQSSQKWIISLRAGASHSSALSKIHFQRPLVVDDVILFNQPWHDLFKHKQTHSICSLDIINLPVRPRQGPFRHPSTQKTRTTFWQQTNLFDGCRVYLNSKFIKILSTQVIGISSFT